MSLKFNKSEFEASLRAVGQGVKRPFSEIVNKALKDVGFRAMQFSEFADPGKIEAELRRNQLALRIASKKLSGRRGKQKVDRFGNTKLTKGGRAQKFGRVTRVQIGRYAAKLIRRRKAGSKAVRAGWIPAVRAFGGTIRAGNAQLRPGRSTAKGYAKKATPAKLNGEIANALITRNYAGKKTNVEQIAMAQRALDQAVQYVTMDRNQHAQERVERELRKHSD